MKYQTRGTFLRQVTGSALLACGGGFALAAARSQPKISDQDILAQCPDRIQQQRLGDGMLTVSGCQRGD